jgi:hypothetical protein
MRLARTFAALAAALLLALSLPAVSVAQSAGDEQYEDPLGGGGGSDAEAAQDENGGEARGAQGDELPRTGWDAFIPAYTGVALLLVGMVAYRLSRPSFE